MNARDSLTEAGARALATRIEKYWRHRGHEPYVRIVRQLMSDSDEVNGTGVYSVRSDMVNGMPRRVGQ